MEELLKAKDQIITKQAEQILLLEQLAEERRKAFVAQSRELAERREFEESLNMSKAAFLRFWLLEDVWPFSLWYRRFDKE